MKHDSDGSNRNSKRRSLLKIGGAAGLSGAVGGTTLLSLFPRTGRTQAAHRHRTPVQTNTAAQRGLAKFVDELPTPSKISPTGTLNNQPFYDVKMRPLL